MKTIWRKLNEIRTKSSSRRSSGIINTTSAGATFHATSDQQYIGVNSDKASTIYLPRTPEDGKVIIVKSEMKPPLGGRKITITTSDGSLIDGYDDITITVSHDCKTLVYHNNAWHLIA
jgi:hypothetical protein